ncbi:hypothetical protein [Gordonia tangerina]|uniref:Uncharacterized protein n=1 Tax=Gordonia tangerina TaxID=2911060 RepID=A0ABS9DRS5_9ACTN|nr:hypothetical protein [Gordonia tangerina]MCF3941302.1 hypothetical protein [Gordonia tangerina]
MPDFKVGDRVINTRYGWAGHITGIFNHEVGGMCWVETTHVPSGDGNPGDTALGLFANLEHID